MLGIFKEVVVEESIREIGDVKRRNRFEVIIASEGAVLKQDHGPARLETREVVATGIAADINTAHRPRMDVSRAVEKS